MNITATTDTSGPRLIAGVGVALVSVYAALTSLAVWMVSNAFRGVVAPQPWTALVIALSAAALLVALTANSHFTRVALWLWIAALSSADVFAVAKGFRSTAYAAVELLAIAAIATLINRCAPRRSNEEL